jgi:hypothetical protein
VYSDLFLRKSRSNARGIHLVFFEMIAMAKETANTITIRIVYRKQSIKC